MFNLQHVLYILTSGALTAVLLFLASKKTKARDKRDLFLKLSAVLTVVIHESDLWVEYLCSGGNAYVGSTHIFPMYPCNIIMWMLLFVAFLENKEGRLFRLGAEFCFIVGAFAGAIGILLNENFAANPTLADYSVLKGLLSHSTMLFGCLYLYFGGYVRPGISSTLSLLFGFGIFVACGLGVNALFAAFGIESPDGIWIGGVPYIGVSSVVLGSLFVALYFGAFALSDLRRPREERWYCRLKNHFQRK